MFFSEIIKPSLRNNQTGLMFAF